MSADHDPPMFEVSGGITPRALASSNSLEEEVENVCQYYVVVVVRIKYGVPFTCQDRDSSGRLPFQWSPGPKYETSPIFGGSSQTEEIK